MGRVLSFCVSIRFVPVLLLFMERLGDEEEDEEEKEEMFVAVALCTTLVKE